MRPASSHNQGPRPRVIFPLTRITQETNSSLAVVCSLVHRAVSGEAEGGAQRRTGQAGGKISCQKKKNDAGGRLEDRTVVEPGGGPGGTLRPAEAPDGGGPEGREGIYVPEAETR